MKEKEVNLRELQLVELEILKEFIKVCNELNLIYYLDSGTLLGCIRHGGFIPWDDDIDVSMPREDYEIFLEKGQALLPEKYFIQWYKTEPEFTMNFAKIRNSDTTFIESSVKNSNINHGVYIDIFPFDGYIPQKKLSNFINCKKYTLYNIQIDKKYTKSYITKSLKTKLICALSNILYKKKSIQELIQNEEMIAKKYAYKDSKYVCSYSYFIEPSKHYMPKEYFGDGIMKNFEGIDARVPLKYDKYLTKIYGDYMKLPPEEERVAHHYNEIIDLNKSYKIYVNNE